MNFRSMSKKETDKTAKAFNKVIEKCKIYVCLKCVYLWPISRFHKVLELFFSTSTFNMQWSLVTCQSHTLQVVFFAIPHSFLHVLLHRTGLLWLQQDLLRHLSSHQDKQLPKEKQYH